MPTDWIIYACLILGLSSALVGGVLKGFSEFIMKGLQLTDPSGGIEAMQHINRTVMRTEFIFSFMALAPLTIGMAAYSWISLSGIERGLIVSACLIYISTVFLVTILGNVPMNNRLARLPFSSAEAEVYWKEYGRKWTQLNHVRTVGSIITSVLFLLAMVTVA